MIINGELQNGIGGGVCQVSTTVFNAAFEAGLSIEQRTNHALYISHYPTGRDATVNYPDIDLVFSNDTDKWLLVRTFVGAGSLTVNLYGTPQGRRVETETAPLEVDGKVPWKRIDDPTMFKGRRSSSASARRPGRPASRGGSTRRVGTHVRDHLEVVLRGRTDRGPARDQAEAEAGDAREARGKADEARCDRARGPRRARRSLHRFRR